MENDFSETLKKLLAISKIDANLAGINAEKSSLDKKLAEMKEALLSASFDYKKKYAAHEAKNSSYQKEEKRIKELQQKLVERRKALSTLGGYKLQMAAEREIESDSKQLSAQEEVLIKSLDQIEELAKAAEAAKEVLENGKKEYSLFYDEYKGTEANFQERVKEYTTERETLLPGIDSRTLSTYERIMQRHPMNPVVPLKKDFTCAGCFMSLGPQMRVELSRATSLVKCPACGRIMYLDLGEFEE